MSTLPLSQHAKQRRKQRGITEHQIEEVLAAPECTYTKDGITCHKRGRILVAVDPVGTIVTVVDRGDSSE